MIPKNDWLQIYVSLKLIKFYAYSVKNNSIERARDMYQEFSKDNFPEDQENNQFDSIPNLVSFAYLLLVRSNEIIERDLESYQEAIFLEIERKLSIGKADNIKEFISPSVENSLLCKYQIIVTEWQNHKKINELKFLTDKIRNSVSHFRYKIEGNLILEDCHKEKNKYVQNFRIILPAHLLLQLVTDFVSIMHDFLKENHLIDCDK
jgi:hypothetical protein